MEGLPCQADPHRAVWMVALGPGAAADVRLAEAKQGPMPRALLAFGITADRSADPDRYHLGMYTGTEF